MILLLLFLLCLPAPAQRRVALTFDDLPNGGASLTPDQLDAMTKRLLGALRDVKAPAIGFVNEGKLDEVESERGRRIAVLRLWLESGFPLGNHTYSHPDLQTTPLFSFEEDVLKGERVIGALMKERGLKLEWFRHPFTHTGPSLQIKDSFESFLHRKGYRVAPFTIENSDYIFERVYRGADAALKEKLRAAYLDFNDTMFAWFERVSAEYLGYELPQILLVHANTINADSMAEMLARLRRRGYAFVTISEAMKDAAYSRRDIYVAPNGPSWLHRWAMSAGKPHRLRDEPDPASWIVELYRSTR